jgi:K+ transporter
METNENPYGVAPNSENGQQVQYAPIKNNGLAITTLILGVLSLMFWFFTAIPGIITGHMALSKIKKNPNENEGGTMAIIGLSLSYIMLLVTIVLVVWVIYMISTIPGFSDTFKEEFYKGLTGQP